MNQSFLSVEASEDLPQAWSGLKPACSSASSLGLESVEDNSELDLAGMADQADGTIVLTLLSVAFLWYRYDERLYPLVRPFLRLPGLLA